MSDDAKIRSRKIAYWGTSLFLFWGYLLLRRSSWQGGVQLHTLMELAATLLALNVGILALVRFYSKKDNTFLFIGTGFLGTGLLDGYHAVVTSSFFMQYFPSPPPSLIPWSWFASRIFLSILLWLSWLFWRRESRLGEAGRVNEYRVYFFSGLFTLTCFLFFAFVPLPAAYQPRLVFPRPQEFIPALFFLLTLLGYLQKGRWKNDAFEHWLVLSLIVGFMSQTMFMSFSGKLYDSMFDAAHLLKKLSYLCTLVGLLFNMYILFQLSEKDVVTIKQMNDALKQSEGRYRSVVDNIAIGVAVISPGMEILSLNRQMRAWFPQIDVSQRPVCYKAFNAPPRGEICVYCPTAKTLRDGLTHEAITETPAGEKIINFRVASSPIRDGEGNVVAAIEMVEDVTERKRAEDEIKKLNEELELKVQERTKQLVAAQEELVRKEKLSVLGQLAGIVGHELRNPLGVIGNAVYFLKTVMPAADDTVREYLDIIKHEVDDSQRIVSDILDFSRTKTPQARQATAGELVELSLGKCVIPEAVKLTVDIPGTLPMVNVDPLQMGQVFQNLIMNAVEAMPNGGSLRISARMIDDCRLTIEEGSQSAIVNRKSSILEKFVEISVTDTGPGIAAENREKLFQPLFTTKAKGIGLGLVVSKRLTEANGGRIEAASETGRGTTFTVLLPVEKGEQA